MEPSYLRSHLPARPAFDLGEADIPEGQHAAVGRLIERTFARAVEHLTLPLEPAEAEGRRGIWLWGLLNVSVAADGTDLRIDHVCGAPGAQAISCTGFATAMSPILEAEALDCCVPPEALSGPIGAYIRRVLVRIFQPCVDWSRLRRAVLGRLQGGRGRALHVRPRAPYYAFPAECAPGLRRGVPTARCTSSSYRVTSRPDTSTRSCRASSGSQQPGRS